MLSISHHQGNANQNPMRELFTPTRTITIKKRPITRVGEDVEKLEPSPPAGGNKTGQPLRTTVWQ